MVLGWLAGIGAGVWVLVAPAVTYDQIGTTLTLIWGSMLAGGSGLVMIAHLTRRYQIEIPGLVLSLGGVVIYGYLSWLHALTTSPGSGPRACLLILLGCLIITRIRVLMHIDREARRIVDLGRGLE